MPGSEFVNAGVRAFYGHAAGQGWHLKGGT